MQKIGQMHHAVHTNVYRKLDSKSGSASSRHQSQKSNRDSSVSFSSDARMGQSLSRLFTNAFAPSEQSRIVVIGLDCAGKTTLLYNQLKLGEVVTTIPQIGNSAYFKKAAGYFLLN
jgi:hypothetical protein